MARILIQEDDSELANVMLRALKAFGHDAIVCADSEQSVARLAESQIDLIIADIFVKRGDKYEPQGGIKLIGHLQVERSRGNPVGDIPVIAMTGAFLNSSGVDVLDQATFMGASATLRKPFALHELHELVKTILSERSADLTRH